jgi:hypothetical protein
VLSRLPEQRDVFDAPSLVREIGERLIEKKNRGRLCSALALSPPALDRQRF